MRRLLSYRSTTGDMVGLRFFVCQQCETVFAEPEVPGCTCSSHESIEEITADVQTEPYFTQLLTVDQ